MIASLALVHYLFIRAYLTLTHTHTQTRQSLIRGNQASFSFKKNDILQLSGRYSKLS